HQVKMFAFKWFGLLLCFLLPSCLETAKILAIFPIPSPSHYIYVLPYLKKLASLGHEVTSVSPFPLKEPFENIRDIAFPEAFEDVAEILKTLRTPMSTWDSTEIANEFAWNLTKKVLNKDVVRREILNPGKAQFDLVIIDLWKLDALYGLGAYFGAPIIGIAPYGTEWKIDRLVGNTSPMSYLSPPSNALTLPDTETFCGRLHTFLEQSINFINWEWRNAAKHEALYRTYFPKVAAKQSLSELSRNFALIFVNQHFALTPPRPYVPNMIEVGGFHIDPLPKPLDKDLEDFVLGAGEEGVIYFSLGSNVRSDTLSPDRLQVLLKTFASLPQRVLWKFDEQLADKPSNVFISNWFSQQDILAHPNVKLFITHGGMLSTIESIHFATPMLGLPFFFDQFRNMEYVRRQGLGLVLYFNEMTADDLKSAIHQLLTDKSFEATVKKVSAQFKDQPMDPMETAIWWTHYILRHKGAPHMRVAGRNLSFFIYNSLDVVLFLLATFFAGLGLLLFLVIKFVKKCSRHGEHKNIKHKKLK
ncbi:hypothetical protein KR018_000886, partial [Drosophila ironensis]